jgi:hypothetical protein
MSTIPRQTRTIGEILFDIGRIDADDVDRALAYQREHGVYFGEALVALGKSTPAEIQYALADQYGIPFVRIHAEEIDREIASRAPAAWIRRHHIIPILRSGDAVAVLLADPGNREPLDELAGFVGTTELNLSVSTPDVIDSLADAVHGESEGRAISVGAFLDDALRAGSTRVGISMRGGVASGWQHVEGERARPGVQLEEGWIDALAERLSPAARLLQDAGQRRWAASLRVGGKRHSVECVAVGRGSDLEWAARLTGAARAGTEAGVDRALVDAVSNLVRTGGGVVHVSEPDGARRALVRDLLPGLPALMLGGAPRTLHIGASVDEETPGAPLAVAAQEDLVAQLEALGMLGLDALTMDVGEVEENALAAAREAAPLVVALAREVGAQEGGEPLTVQLRRGETGFIWTVEGGDAAD